MATEGETLPEGAHGTGERGIEMGSDMLGILEEGSRVWLVGAGTGLAEVVAGQDRSGVDPYTVREEAIGSEGCDGFRLGIVKVGEVGTEVGEHGTHVAEKGMVDEEMAADE